MSNVAREGYINVPGGLVWYRIVGSGDRLPLLTLHGGPGMPHNYLAPLQALSAEHPVIFYDQLGCGKSDQPQDTSLWSIDRFVEELQVIRDSLGLDRVHLFGHSWGSMLATDYFLTRKPTGLASLILAGPFLSVDRFLKDVTTYRRQLPDEIRSVLDEHEAAGNFDAPEFEEAAMVFYRRHFCRLDPWPAPLKRTWETLAVPVYRTMWGPTEFIGIGNLAGYDRTEQFGEITVPTLLTCGRYDEAAPETAVWYHSLIPSSELVIFEESSHTPHLEETERYISVVREFLNRVEDRQLSTVADNQAATVSPQNHT